MFPTDVNTRRLLAAEHAARLAADARPAPPRNEPRPTRRRHVPLAAGLRLAQRVHVVRSR
jgi:hypothetical protein